MARRGERPAGPGPAPSGGVHGSAIRTHSEDPNMTRLARLGTLLIPALLLAGAGSGRLAAQAGVTGKCKDGTTTSARSKSGAGRGHGGVAQWSGTAAASTT